MSSVSSTVLPVPPTIPPSSSSTVASSTTTTTTNTISPNGPLVKSLPSGLVLRFEAPPGLGGNNKNDIPVTIGTPPGTPLHMSSNNLQIHNNQSSGRDSSLRGTPPFKSINNDISNNNRGSPMLSPLGLPPTRVDTDEDLMQKQVLWEIDRNELEWEGSAKLGAGAFGEVMRAKWRGTPVAVKKVNLSASGAVRELRHEIAVMSHMHHPRVVQFLGASTRSQPWLVVFEFLPGGALSTLLEKRQGRLLPFKVAGRFALDCAQGLRYLHEHKPTEVVHRDLKPNNLVIDASGHCKITDFGLAKVVDIIKTQSDTYVMTGETGSYRYMAPEVFRHEKYTEKVDIYAFAMILYYLTHGEPPFAWMPALEAAKAASLQHLRPEIRPSLNRDVANLIESCWRAEANTRPSAREVCTILEKIFPDDETSDPIGSSNCCTIV